MPVKSKKTKFIDTLKIIIYITIGGITIGGTIVGIDHYFAKSTEVEVLKNRDQLFEERIDISIVNDRIYQTRQQIQRIEDKRILQYDPEPKDFTITEKEWLEKEKKELERLEKEKEEKIKTYDEIRKTRKM